jgi:tRNA(Met) cytidine acetyltransferase
MVNHIVDVAVDLLRQARASGQRRGLVLAGERDWCTTAARSALVPELDPVLWVTDRAPAGVWALPGEEADAVLGQEVGAVVFDAHAGFNPDAFGAISGTLRGGGLMLLLTPPLAVWPRFRDPDCVRMAASGYDAGDVGGRFLERLLRVIRDDNAVRVRQRRRHSPPSGRSTPPAASPPISAVRWTPWCGSGWGAPGGPWC